MKTKRVILLTLPLILTLTFSVQAQDSSSSLGRKKYLFNWIESNVSPRTGMPLSFYIDKNNKREILKNIGLTDSVTGIIERMIVNEGISIYDASLWQIVLSRESSPALVEKAKLPTSVYWLGQLGDLMNIRSGGFSKQSFIYDPGEFARVSSEPTAKGSRGFIFRILNANGRYLSQDPLDGKEYFEEYPNWPRLHWEDWKPIAGENAWVVVAAMHLYQARYYDKESKTYHHDFRAQEFLLAEELARAAMILQAGNGGIRMAPIGTYFYSLERPAGRPLEEFIKQYDRQGKVAQEEFHNIIDRVGFEQALLEAPQSTWYYYEQSTENNLSWYIALRALYDITQDEKYLQAMRKIESYLRSVWNDEENYFYQGTHFTDGHWAPNTKHFASDVQTWAICKLGPAKIDAWFGKGAAHKMWLAVKRISGVIDGGRTLGIGYSSENDRISVEWTMGAVYAMHELAHYYYKDEPDWARNAFADAVSMRKEMEKFKTTVGPDAAAYPYSSKREWIPFGWFSHSPGVLSLASTCWVYLYDAQFNPFYIGSKRDFIFGDI